MKLIRRDPDKGYIDNMLWLPKTQISAQQIAGALMYKNVRDKTGSFVQAWQDSPHHFLVPRNYVRDEFRGAMTFPIIDARFRDFPKVKIRSKVVLDAQRPDLSYQREGSAAIQGAYDGILCLRCGGGKALDNREPVLTADGWKPIGQMTVRDRVVGMDGRLYPVLGVYPQGARPMYKVTFSDGTEVRADGDHLWRVHSQDELYRGSGEGKLLTTDQIRETGLAFAGGQKRFFVKTAAPVQGTRREFFVDPYTLGVLLGDGGLTHAVYLTTDDEIIRSLPLPPGLHCVDSEDLPNVRSVRVVGKEGKKNTLLTWIRSQGLNVRSEEKHIPSIYMGGSIAQRTALLQGLFDTDGYASKGTGVEYTTASPRLADQVIELVQGLGGVASVTTRVPAFTYRGEKHEGQLSYRLYIQLPPEVLPFRLSRKASAYDRKRKVVRSMVSIEPCGDAAATCIRVDSPDHLFRTRGHVLTHNTVVSLHAAAAARVPILIVVDELGLAHQWKQTITAVLEPDDPVVGFVGHGKNDWKHSVTIATVHTLAKLVKSGEFTALSHHFGIVIFDECHVMSAPIFNTVVNAVHGRRWGISATPAREDIYDSLLRFSVGKIVYTYLMPETRPHFYFYQLPTPKLDATKTAKASNSLGNFHYASAYGVLAEDPHRMATIVKEVKMALAAGRQCLVLSHSRKACEVLAAALPGSGLVHGGVSGPKRLDRIQKCNPVVAIMKIGEKALDKPMLDTIFIVDPVAKVRRLQQIMGRALRIKPGKRHPTVILFEDRNIRELKGACNKARRLLREWPEEQGGALPIAYLAPGHENPKTRKPHTARGGLRRPQ